MEWGLIEWNKKGN